MSDSVTDRARAVGEPAPEPKLLNARTVPPPAAVLALTGSVGAPPALLTGWPSNALGPRSKKTGNGSRASALTRSSARSGDNARRNVNVPPAPSNRPKAFGVHASPHS